MFHTVHEGSFLSHAGVTWNVRILRDLTAAPSSVGELDFPAAAPLTIDWLETSKDEVICGSTATLTVLSPGDRTYMDLYTVAPAAVKLEVRRNGSLYWSGSLDPEFYEEPYSRGRDYEVSFTFSDFGILDRLPYNYTGLKTLRSIIDGALSRAAITYGSLDLTLISTLLSGSTVDLSSIQVRSDNFYDEDGVAVTMYEALEGILRPLALRIVQKAGNIYIYDINALHSSASSRTITWGGDDQTLGVDRVVNNIKVTLSIYGSAELGEEFGYTGDTPVEKVNLTTDEPSDGDYYSFYPDYNVDSSTVDYRNVSFTIFQSSSAEGLQWIHTGMKYFKIVPVLGGEGCEGVRQWFVTGHSGTQGLVRKGMADGTPADGEALIKTEPVRLTALQTASGKRLKIVLEVLADARYNPFSEPGDYNEQTDYDNMVGLTCMDVPVKVELLDETGTAAYHYTNRSVRDAEYTSGAVTVERVKGSWESGAAAYDDCVLRYYNAGDESLHFMGGWIANRQAVNVAMQYLRNLGVSGMAPLGASLLAADDGQFIPYPPAGGRIQITVCAGLKLMRHYYTAGSYQVLDRTSVVRPTLRWLLWKAPEVTIVNNNLVYDDAEEDDVEYTGVANADAREDLEIEEICGTMTDPSPVARGLLLDSSGQGITAFARAGRTDTAEQLLIGTLYSQYAARKLVLSGTAMSYSDGLRTFTDANMAGRKFMALSELEDCIGDETEIKVAETAADNYTSQ